jgi:hypothetical protein
MLSIRTTERIKGVYGRTLEKYKATIGYLRQYFKEETADCMTVSAAESFVEWL